VFILFWIIFILFILVSLALVAIVIMQEPKQGGLGEGLGGGAAQDFSSTRGGTAGGLQRLTIYLGVTWGLLALAIAVIPRA
jgi:preprotein translocase subunit SecG